MSELLVPLRVDALWLDRPTRVIGPPADYEILPWFDGERDHFPETAFVASAINAEPFADHAHVLAPGVHLHWSLPPGLTRGTTEARDDWVQVGDLSFPPVPNRWIVVRDAPRAAWLVESDHIHPLDGPRPRDATVIPHLPPEAGRPPYRVIGRCVTLDPVTLEATVDDEPVMSLADAGIALSALGSGDPTFAGLYTSCRNVFGMHDPDPPDPGRVQYWVWGHYDGDIVDPLAALAIAHDGDVDAMRRRLGMPADAELSDEQRASSWQRAVTERFGWRWEHTVELDSSGAHALARPSGDDRPTTLRCFGVVEIDGPADDHSQLAPRTDSATEDVVAVAESAADAAAALVARQAGITADVDRARLADVLRATDLTDHHLDLTAKAAEAAHTATFRSANGPAIWMVRHPGADTTEVTLPLAAADALHRLNAAQAAFDRAADHVAVLREALFADWHHLMSATYREADDDDFAFDPAALADLIERTRLGPLEEHLAALGVLTHGLDGSGAHVVASSGGDETRAADVVRRHAALSGLLPATDATLVVSRVPGPRFWRPRDPVLLVDTPAAHPRDRFAPDGDDDGPATLECVVFGVPRAQFAVCQALLLDASDPVGPPFSHELDRAWWQPVLAEWEIEFRSRDRADPGSLPTGSGYISGRSVINTSATRLLADRLAQLGAPAAPDLAPGTPAPPTDPLAGLAAQADDLRRVGVVTLGGFHDRLLQRRAEPQLPVADPIGTPWQRALADRVAAALGDHHPDTPDPDAAFVPVRDGDLLLERLRIVDEFGRTVEWHPTQVVAPPGSDTPGGGQVGLPRRLSQPGRLDLSWLSAGGDEAEVNSHPASSPICGWIVPNDLDDDIAVHDADGRLLGTVTTDGSWEPAPADPAAPLTPDDIAVRSLARVVGWMVEQAAQAGDGVDELDTEPTFIAALTGRITTALDGIDPADGVAHTTRAVLVGRPVAVVRSRLALTLQHEPATDASWAALRHRLAGSDPPGPGFEIDTWPVTVGAPDQFGDALVGYWVETDDGTFDAGLRPPAAAPIELALAGPATTMTMLVDPRGAVHAACDVVPTTSIRIAADQYRTALDQLRTTFHVAPLLTPPDAVALALPAEPAFSWAWLERDDDAWLTVPHHPTVHRSAVLAAFGTRGDPIWSHLVDSRRVLLEDHADAGLLMPPDPTAPAVDEVIPGVTSDQLERALHALAESVVPATTRAGATARVVAREGWLELRPVPGHHAWDDSEDTSS